MLDNENLKWAIEGSPALAVIALAYIFVGIYGLAWAPGAWIYASEVFPLRYRAKGVGLAAAGNWRYVFDNSEFLLYAISSY